MSGSPAEPWEEEDVTNKPNNYAAAGKQESCLSGSEKSLLQGNVRVATAFAKPPPRYVRSLSPVCPFPGGEELGAPNKEAVALPQAGRAALVCIIQCGFNVQ